MTKKNIKLILCLILLTVIACSSSNNVIDEVASSVEISDGDVIQDEISNSEAIVDNKPTNSSDISVSVSERMLFDKEGITITLKSITLDDLFGPGLNILIENNSNKSITVQTRKSTVNDVMIDTIFSSDVLPGKKANETITFMSSNLKTADIKTIKDIEFVFHIFDSESWDEILDSETINITTSASPSFIQDYDDSGFVALEQKGIKIVIKKLTQEDSIFGTDLNVYIENNGDQDATIQIRDMSVNGFMIDPIFSCDVLSGKKAYSAIRFMESDLTDNSIENFEILEFSFHIFNFESWDDIYDSEPITVSFTE